MKALANIVFVFLFFLAGSLNAFPNEIDSIKSLIDSEEEDYLKAQHLNNLSRAYIKEGNYENAIKTSSRALNYAKWYNYNHCIVDAYRIIGFSYYHKSNYSKAIENYLYATKYLKKTRNYKKLADNYYDLAYCYYQLQNPTEALEYNELGIQALKNEPNVDKLVDFYFNISNSYILLQKYSLAVSYLRKGLDLRERAGDPHKIGDDFNRLGYGYWSANQYDSALKYFHKFLENSIVKKDSSAVSMAYTNIGIILTHQGSKSAISYLSRSLALNTKFSPDNYLPLAYAYLRTKNIEKATHYFHLAKGKTANIKELIIASDSITEYYQKIGKTDSVASFLLSGRDLRETFFKSSLEEVKMKEKAKYEVEGVEERILENENAALARENLEIAKSNNQLLVITILLLVGLIVSILYNYRKSVLANRAKIAAIKETLLEIGKVMDLQ